MVKSIAWTLHGNVADAVCRGAVCLGGRGSSCSRSSRRTPWSASTPLPVEVEVDVSPASMPKTGPGRPGRDGRQESTHRVERALVNSGYRRVFDRVVINLAPADLKKDAGGFDLPIALGTPGRQRAGGLRAEGELRGGRRARPDRRDAADQGGAGDGPGRRRGRTRRHARPRRQRRRGRRRRGDLGLPHRQPLRGRRASSPASSTSTPRPSTSTRSSAAAPTTRTTSSTSRGRTTPSGPC